MLERALKLTSVGNARQLGGIKLKDGRRVRENSLLRVAEINNISKEDIDTLINIYKLHCIVDFRMSNEVLKRPDPEFPGVRYVNARILDEELMRKLEEDRKREMGGFDMMEIFYSKDGLGNDDRVLKLKNIIDSGFMNNMMYVEFLEKEQGKLGYAEFFRELINCPKDKSVMFHCTQGKDRTGISSMLILSVLGADRDSILDDYILTNEFNSKLIAKEEAILDRVGITGTYKDRILSMMDRVDITYLENAIDHLEEKYGSVVNYVKEELNVTDAEIEALRDNYIE
ncbi:MAG: tyrosine-protein phosphatase [Lachnospiraceae bacterium]|nr:tyrosine-protein phosphatase [Lachnospiraceae bacterium]